MPVIRREVTEIERRYKSDVLIEVGYYLNNRMHRDPKEGPACSCYHDDGSISTEEYFVDGELHREDGPAIVDYNKDGSIYQVHYYRDGKLHREDGPAICFYNFDGKTEDLDDGFCEYHKNGVNITTAINASGCKPGTIEFSFTWDLL